MNRDYAKAATEMPHQALAIKLCELAGIDIEHVQDVDIHCTARDFPVVTFTCLMHHKGDIAASAEVIKTRYEMRLMDDVEGREERSDG